MMCQMCDQNFITQWNDPNYTQMWHLAGYKLEGYNNTISGTVCTTCFDSISKNTDDRAVALVKATLKGLIRN